jgi:hypothetical protein
MKKVLLLIVTLVLAACGGGGGGAQVTDVNASTPTGVLAISFAPEHDPSKALASFAPGKHVRVVIRNQSLRFNGNVFSVIMDAVPGDPLNFALPVAAGYTVEALAYNTDASTGINTVVKYAYTPNVRVTTSGTSGATLTLYPVAATLQLSQPVIQQGAMYAVLANLSSAGGRHLTALQSSWYLPPPKTATFAPFTNRTSATSYLTSHLYTVPITGGAPTTIYFQGVFTIKYTLLMAGESPKQWEFDAPEISLPVTADTNLTIVAPDF